MATEFCKGSPIFPQLIISQAIVESSGKYEGKNYVGGSQLARDGNNYFGMKAGGTWHGETITLPTKEVVNGEKVTVEAHFRKYDSPVDSLKDYLKMLMHNKRYAKVREAKTFEAQLKAIGGSGYSTNPKYAAVLDVGKAIEKAHGTGGSSTMLIAGAALLAFLLFTSSKK